MAKKKRTVKKRFPYARVYGGIYAVLSLIVLLHERTAPLGSILFNCFKFLFGILVYPFFAVLFALGIYMVVTNSVPKLKTTTNNNIPAGIIVALIAALIIFAVPKDHAAGKAALTAFTGNAKDIFNGEVVTTAGLFGILLYAGISALTTFIGAYIVAAILLAIAVSLIINVPVVANTVGKFLAQVGKIIKIIALKFIEILKWIWKGIVKLFGWISDKVREKKAEAPKKKKPQTIDIDVNKKEPIEYNIDTYVDERTGELKPRTIAVAQVQQPTEKKKEIKEDTTTTEIFHSNVGDTVIYGIPSKYSISDLTGYFEKNMSGDRFSKVNERGAIDKAKKLDAFFETFGIRGTQNNPIVGPCVTRLEFKPEAGIKVSKITSLQEDIKLALEVKDVRIEAPIPGKAAVGIEVPNEERLTVRMRDLLADEVLKKDPTFQKKYADSKLLIALGKNLSNEPVYDSIDKLPHLLIAGSTGSGKSVCINSIILTLITRTKPEEVKLILIDPKRVEFTPYQKLPNLLTDVINDASQANKALSKICEVMDARYSLFNNEGVRGIKEYNQKFPKNKLPYIVVIIDELADLMLSENRKEVEKNIQRITQLARACGIHLIVATQRPSTDVITGTIKTNIPSRIAFAVSSAIDSRIILDETGAEGLLGNGDMLYKPMGQARTERIQGIYVSDNEIEKITKEIKDRAEHKVYYSALFDEGSADGQDGFSGGVQSNDPMYDEVKKYIARTKKASTSSIQRYFGLGYNRAARIIDALEQEGSIGPANGSKPREVYIEPEE